MNMFDKIPKLLEPLNAFLANPNDRDRGVALLSAVRSQAKCEAVCLCLSIDNPNYLEVKSIVGYKPHYLGMKYYFNEEKKLLTAYVGKNHVAVNTSVHDLMRVRKPGGAPYSGRCRMFLISDTARNVLAVPVLAGAGRTLGVLKFENKIGTSDREAFPAEDVALAHVLACAIGAGLCQRMSGRLLRKWVDTERASRGRNRHVLLQFAADHLATILRAECASIFVRTRNASGERALQYEAGVGYTPEYAFQQYVLNRNPDSFTTYVANFGQSVRFWEREILATRGTSNEIPYKGACQKYILSGSFRNILAVPLADAEDCRIVIKVENKLPSGEMFDEVDELVCQEFLRHEIARLVPNEHPDVISPGVRLLLANIGAATADSIKDQKKLLAARELAKQQPKIILTKDLLSYFRLEHREQLRRAFLRAEKALHANTPPAPQPAVKRRAAARS